MMLNDDAKKRSLEFVKGLEEYVDFCKEHNLSLDFSTPTYRFTALGAPVDTKPSTERRIEKSENPTYHTSALKKVEPDHVIDITMPKDSEPNVIKFSEESKDNLEATSLKKASASSKPKFYIKSNSAAVAVSSKEDAEKLIEAIKLAINMNWVE